MTDLGYDLTLTWRDGRETTVEADGDETVLDAAESADVGLPFGCRTGACATCVGRLVDGDVSYDRPPRALRPRHVEAGYVLCCVACPEADCHIEVDTNVQSRLFPNPWK